MNKKFLLHVGLYTLAVAVYIFTSPNSSRNIRTEAQESKKPDIAGQIATIEPTQQTAEVIEGAQELRDTIASSTPTSEITLLPPPIQEFEYIKVLESCGTQYDGGECVNVRAGPATDYDAIAKLRAGVVLKIDKKVLGEDGREWYKISFDEWLRYADRLNSDWYVAADLVTPFLNPGPQDISQDTASTSKKIIVDLSDQKIYAYDGETLFMEELASTGVAATPTPRGTFKIFRKTPSRYMQGPIPGISEKIYDLPGVPWNLYFTSDGAVFHGAYWHNDFGNVHSNGCVNLPPEKAEELYAWAELGTKVYIRD
jgi:hypothetical protein